ncbi:MAG: carbon-nitrogen family hydrolase [Proteobacteria bacterium]|nr:carbon-nitrogen family hydrolase [Pseudomonadota bacterium]
MKVALVQTDTIWQDPEANFAKVDRMLDALGDQKPELICLPEMFSTGYTKDRTLWEDAEGKTFQFCQDLAKRRGAWVQGTFPETCDLEVSQGVTPDGEAKGYNTSVVIDPSGALRCRYYKMHPFTHVKEHHFYNRGDALPVFELGPFNAATPICYDLRFPEIFRQAAFRGANLFIVPANWPVERKHHWRALAIARAIENLSYVVAINRVGTGGGLTYAGPSLVISPQGDVLMETDGTELIAMVDIDRDEVTRTRERFGFLNDMRADLFPDLFSHATQHAHA